MPGLTAGKEIPMTTETRFGDKYRKWAKGEVPPDICEVCGGELETDPEAGEEHCPVCENPEE